MRTYQESARVFKAPVRPKNVLPFLSNHAVARNALVFTRADGFNTVWPILSHENLCDSGLVVSRQEGKWTHYRLSETGKDEAVELPLALPHRTQNGYVNAPHVINKRHHSKMAFISALNINFF